MIVLQLSWLSEWAATWYWTELMSKDKLRVVPPRQPIIQMLILRLLQLIARVRYRSSVFRQEYNSKRKRKLRIALRTANKLEGRKTTYWSLSWSRPQSLFQIQGGFGHRQTLRPRLATNEKEHRRVDFFLTSFGAISSTKQTRKNSFHYNGYGIHGEL